ncbi:histone deacetylase family protein [Hufsiella ginkgonis]|uniref:Histone deacetylase n=1 Tax=Hufsiella ginkgonis TaxID=2695274 RepID=A0A7K1Y269_9SPHI|nr:histone deacetylase [Hufsiella ginkgonis]MXV17360.1 histone deacetylase [Hufsiella ginkgonis]
MIKYGLIPEQLRYEGTILEDDLFPPVKVSEEVILLTHEKNYWERLRDLRLSPAEIRRTGFPLTRQLVDREMIIAGGTVACCRFALESGIAFNVAGGTHHAGSNWAEGFCLLNDQAIAANFLLAEKLADAILVVDLDVHQGNGTAEIFKSEERVFTFSMHAEYNFPFRKEKSDLDIGLADGTGDDTYLSTLEQTLVPLFDRVKPGFVFFLSGVDVLATDNLGRLKLTRQGCAARDKLVLELCHSRKVPVQVSMGGGYSPGIIDIVEAHCNTFRLAQELFF